MILTLTYWLLSSLTLDIDECNSNGDPCHSNATCTDTEGSYTCVCDEGFTGDGYNCSGRWRLMSSRFCMEIKKYEIIFYKYGLKHYTLSSLRRGIYANKITILLIKFSQSLFISQCLIFCLLSTVVETSDDCN